MASVGCICSSFKQILLLVVILGITVTCVKSARMLEVEQPEEHVTGDQTPVSTVPSGLQPGASGGTSTAATAAIVNAADPHHPLTFFMHDILGGSNPSARAVTGIVTNPAVNAQVAFAKPNGANINVNNGIPQNNGNNGIINNNNIPFLTGLGGFTSNVLQNNGNNIGNGGGAGFPITTGGQLPAGMTFQKLMFGTLTVFDDELTEGAELGSGLAGKAHGFYIASSEDGNSQTMAFTVMLAESGYADSLSFFGVHRTAVSESHLAVMGGTGKFVDAQGFAIVKTFSASNQHQHETDGVETILQFTVYLTY